MSGTPGHLQMSQPSRSASGVTQNQTIPATASGSAQAPATSAFLARPPTTLPLGDRPPGVYPGVSDRPSTNPVPNSSWLASRAPLLDGSAQLSAAGNLDTTSLYNSTVSSAAPDASARPLAQAHLATKFPQHTPKTPETGLSVSGQQFYVTQSSYAYAAATTASLNATIDVEGMGPAPHVRTDPHQTGLPPPVGLSASGSTRPGTSVVQTYGVYRPVTDAVEVVASQVTRREMDEPQSTLPPTEPQRQRQRQHPQREVESTSPFSGPVSSSRHDITSGNASLRMFPASRGQKASAERQQEQVIETATPDKQNGDGIPVRR